MEIPAAARVCPHCRRDLVPGESQKVTVTGADPFAAYHTPIQGKKPGQLTVVGHLGVGLGALMVGVAGLALTQARDGGAGAFVIALLGVGVAVASYLWVRR